ncbi:MAG TPA: glutaredoxin [Oceanospirillales bacterium]|nr:glutaredoxin [Oceanospirillales bacterium]
MVIVRKFLGSIILFFNWLFVPKSIERDAASQTKVNVQTEKLKLYQFGACPFCVKVRRAMKRMSLNIELRDASNNQEFRDELASQGGKIKVPCLRIERDDDTTQWLYESTEIIKYLESKFS